MIRKLDFSNHPLFLCLKCAKLRDRAKYACGTTCKRCCKCRECETYWQVVTDRVLDLVDKWVSTQYGGITPHTIPNRERVVRRAHEIVQEKAKEEAEFLEPGVVECIIDESVFRALGQSDEVMACLLCGKRLNKSQRRCYTLCDSCIPHPKVVPFEEMLWNYAYRGCRRCLGVHMQVYADWLEEHVPEAVARTNAYLFHWHRQWGGYYVKEAAENPTYRDRNCPQCKKPQ